MDIAPLVVWAAGIGSLISLATTIWNIVTSGARTNAKRLHDHSKRLEHLERQVDRVPSQSAIHRLELTLTTLTGDLGRIEERLKPVASIAERMQELMIEQGKGK